MCPDRSRSLWRHALSVLVVAWSGLCGADEAVVPPQELSTHPSLAVIAPAPPFALPDIEGHPVRLESYRGQVLLLAFVFTSCKTVCPMISRQMAQLQAGLRQDGVFGKRASMLSVTIDPETDSIDALKQYAANLGADAAGWRFLREERAALKAVLKAYDEWSRLLPEGEMDHPARVYLIDREGRIREIYSLAFFDHRQVLLDIRALLTGADG